MRLPAYFELNGKFASMEPLSDGGVRVSVPDNMWISDFMQNGNMISKEEYLKHRQFES